MYKYFFAFAVDKKATKIEIKKAVEFIFQVKVDSVNTFNVPKKPKRVGRFNGFVAGYKKAIVKISEGSIQILPDEGIAKDVDLKEDKDKETKLKAKVKEISDIEQKVAEKIKKAEDKEKSTK